MMQGEFFPAETRACDILPIYSQLPQAISTETIDNSSTITVSGISLDYFTYLVLAECDFRQVLRAFSDVLLSSSDTLLRIVRTMVMYYGDLYFVAHLDTPLH